MSRIVNARTASHFPVQIQIGSTKNFLFVFGFGLLVNEQQVILGPSGDVSPAVRTEGVRVSLLISNL
jgi:hypothetical protein